MLIKRNHNNTRFKKEQEVITLLETKIRLFPLTIQFSLTNIKRLDRKANLEKI